jgi:hypothetical protein
MTQREWVNDEPSVKLPRRPQFTSSTKEAVTSDGDRDLISTTTSRAPSTARLALAAGISAQQITTNDAFSLYDRLSTKNDVCGADDLATTGDFIAGILCECVN